MAVLVALGRDPGALFVIPLLFVLVVPFEKLFPRHRQQIRRPELKTDLAYSVAQPVLAAVGVAVAIVIAIASLAWVPGLLIRPFVLVLPTGVRAIVGILLFDLAIYWAHRWSHEVPFLWRFHAVHHSTKHLDWISGFRVHPFDGAFIAPPFAFLLGAGFSPEFTGVLTVIQLVLGLFLHANVRWRWRPLHRVVITPEFHHWHHSNERDAWMSNYAVFLPLWDIAFGTYFMPKDRRPRIYGVDDPVPSTIMGQLRWPLRGLRNPLRWFAHPVRETRLTWRAVRRGMTQLAASAARPRRSHEGVLGPVRSP